MPEAIISQARALEVAQIALSQNFAEADFGFAAGSIMRGAGTILSDIDLVVVYSSLPNAHRESFIKEGIPVEVFVYDPSSLRWFLHDNARSGYPDLLTMVIEGLPIGPRQGAAAAVRREAHTLLAAGPPALSRQALERMRYEITDKLDDLRGNRTDAEIVATGAALYAMLANFALRGRGAWSGAGKWAPRRLAEIDHELGQAFTLAFDKLFCTKDPSAVISLAESELSRHGGPLFDGYRLEAPAEWRIEIPEI